jgi:hypothetical protein
MLLSNRFAQAAVLGGKDAAESRFLAGYNPVGFFDSHEM